MLDQCLEPFVSGRFSFLFKTKIPYDLLIFLLLVFFLGALIIIITFKDNRKRINIIAISAVVINIIMLYCHTVIFRAQKGVMQYKLIPFWSYIDIVNHNKTEFLVENILNVILFLPVGLFIGLVLGRRKWKSILMIGAGISVLIELSQLLLLRGLCEFDDVFHNTVGCALGYALYLVSRHAIWANIARRNA